MIACIEDADVIEKILKHPGWMRPHRPSTVHCLGDGLITHRDVSDAIKECHCQDSGRTERLFSTKNVFKPGFQAAQYLADSMGMWFILLIPCYFMANSYFMANNNQQRTKLRADILSMSLRVIFAQNGSAPFFCCGWR